MSDVYIDPATGIASGNGGIEDWQSSTGTDQSNYSFNIFGNGSTTLGQSKYDFRYRVFPEDLTSENLAHYMVININVPTSGDTSRSGINYRTTVLPGEYSKVDTLRFGNYDAGGAQKNEGYVFPRSTRRIAESIALYMPNSLAFNSQHVYEEASMTALMGTVGTAVGKFAGGLIGSNVGPAAAGAGYVAGGFLGGLFGDFGGTTQTISRMAGYPINPRVEVLYAMTPQRQFVFEILMAPRSQKEAQTVQEICRVLRYHAAPELSKIAGIVPSFIPPAEFDITFYNKGAENTHLPRINTCFLERIEVDYAPTGVYATFSDGNPVAVRLSMGFREIEILHKLRIKQGF